MREGKEASSSVTFVDDGQVKICKSSSGVERVNADLSFIAKLVNTEHTGRMFYEEGVFDGRHPLNFMLYCIKIN